MLCSTGETLPNFLIFVLATTTYNRRQITASGT